MILVLCAGGREGRAHVSGRMHAATHACSRTHATRSARTCAQVALYDIPLTDAPPGGKGMGRLRKYAVMLADTVVISESGPVCVTDQAPKERKDIMYEIEDDEEEEEEVRGGWDLRRRWW